MKEVTAAVGEVDVTVEACDDGVDGGSYTPPLPGRGDPGKTNRVTASTTFTRHRYPRALP